MNIFKNIGADKYNSRVNIGLISKLLRGVTSTRPQLPDSAGLKSVSKVGNEPKRLSEAGSARRKRAQEQSLYVISEHLKLVYNTATATQPVL